MDAFAARDYPPQVAELLTPERVPELGPGSANREVEPKLDALERSLDLGAAIHNREAARCCVSGLWLHHDFLDRSHEISQEISAPMGSYWHGIMHRREGDFWNAKYWFRRAGELPACQEIAATLPQAEEVWRETLGPVPADVAVLIHLGWDPARFVDTVESANGRGGAEEDWLRRIALLEWRVLFAACYDRAVSG